MIRLLVLYWAVAGTLAAQAPILLGFPTDPCTASTAYAPIPMRFGFLFSCTFRTPAGGGPYYEVTLGFREPTYTTAGNRSFDVAVNGYKVLAAFDPIAAYIADGSNETIILRKVPAVSSDGTITVQLTTLMPGRNAVLSTVAIAPISCGHTATAYYHILSTGQSLSVGAFGTPILSSAQPYKNLMLSPGVEASSAPLIPLIENGTGQNGNIETPSSGIANTVSALDSNAHPVVVGLHGKDGLAYTSLAKGTAPYATGQAQATATRAYVQSTLGGAYIPIAVTAYHGETDDNNNLPGPTYEADLKQWQIDYETDLNALTGRSDVIPLFINQMNSGIGTGDLATSQFLAHRDDPGKVILVGPKYQYAYVADSTHLTNISYRHSGELMGRVIKKVVIDHQTWNPTMPVSVLRTGNTILVKCNVPVGPLAIDTTIVPTQSKYGFDFVQTGGSAITIASVVIADPSQITVTLSGIPTGTNQRLRYAWGGNHKGNIRDNDTAISPASDSTRMPLYNWLVTFDEPVIEVQPLSTNTIAATQAVMDLVANCGAVDASIWGSTSPGTLWQNDPQSVTLGTKFRSDVAGTVTGIRFYKGAGNNGTHVGLLYSGTGALLAQASFSGEGVSGWQTVNLSPAVSISANTTYIAALFTTSGYGYDQNYFSSAVVDHPPLHALREGVDGSNGMFTYGGTPQFPTQSYLSSNYWVDIMSTALVTPSCSAGFAAVCAMSADQIPDNCNVNCGPVSGFVGCGPALTRDTSGAWSLTAYGLLR